MRRVDCLVLHKSLILGFLVLAGCMDSGERAAQQWLSERQAHQSALTLEPVPPIVDALPASYRSKVLDPFLPERISSRAGVADIASRSGAIFPDAPLASLSVVGYLSGENRLAVAMVRYGTQYRGVHVGDRLSQQRASVRQIGPQGVLLALDGMPEQWLPINKP